MEKEKAVTIENVTYLIQRTYVGTCTKAELIRNVVREKAKAAEVDRSAGHDV